MSTITKPSARIIADSISLAGHRFTTMEVTMHRFVLAQAGEQLAPGLSASCREEWLRARYAAVDIARNMASLGLHKQVVNRLLEPFLWHTVVVVSATEWENFFAQRCSPLAQPEIRAVAEAMEAALKGSEPRLVEKQGWHLPYCTVLEDYCEGIKVMLPDSDPVADLRHLSVARCARVSYGSRDSIVSLQKDLDLYNRLLTADPPHASPFEHVARPARPGEVVAGNFQGWVQLRQELGLGWARRPGFQGESPTGRTSRPGPQLQNFPIPGAPGQQVREAMTEKEAGREGD